MQLQNIVWIFIAILGGLIAGFFVFGKKRENKENENKNDKDNVVDADYKMDEDKK